MDMQTIALEKSHDYTEKNLRPALENIFSTLMPPASFHGKTVLVKPNMLLVEPPVYLASTHPAFIEQVLSILIDAGSKPFVFDVPVFSTMKQSAIKMGLDRICKRLGVPILKSEKTVSLVSPANFPDVRLPPVSSRILECDCIINLPKLKVHDQMCLTCAVKNLFGCVGLFKRVKEHQACNSSTEQFARMLLAISEVVKPVLNIVDGVTAMETSGPRGGVLRNLGMVFGGVDALAVDFAAAKLLCADVESIPVLKAALQAGLEPGISFVGEKFENLMCREFVFPEQAADVTFRPVRALKIVARKFLGM